MKYFFIVQGEGLGHSTQSLALRAMLERNGHEVVETLLGRSFFRKGNPLYQQIPHRKFFSPFFINGFNRMGISLLPTFAFNILGSPIYIFEILRIAFKIRHSTAHKVVVFYDVIGQLASFLSFSGKPVYSISHHFFFEHPSFIMPANRTFEKYLLFLHSFLASAGAQKKLALSFTRESDLPGKRIYIVPPLLRKEILHSSPVAGNYVHAYCLHPGFLNSISRLANKNPDKGFMVFLHTKTRNQSYPPNLSIFNISGEEFLESFINAGFVMCTAGFETLCEAVYLNKPLIIVPSHNHFEQYCNSLDAKRAGAATVVENFENAIFMTKNGNPGHANFMSWINKSEEMMLQFLAD